MALLGVILKLEGSVYARPLIRRGENRIYRICAYAHKEENI